MSFSQFDFQPELLQGLTEMGFDTPTPIQTQTIPLLLNNQDVIGLAQTGTGKTAAFALPIIQRLKPGSKHPQALIVTPTRELAEQIVSAIDKYCKYLPIKALAVYGGISARAQERALQQGVDIVVATPGRLIDHLQNAVIRLYNVKYLVLDEADRMLDMGFIPDIETMITYLPKDRQTLLFSATMPPQVEHLAKSLTQNATTIEADVRSQGAKTVSQRLFKVAQTRKMELLLELLAEDVVDSVIVFSQTKHGADRITRDLIGAGISATCIHSNYTQTQRQKSLDGFKKGDYAVLVATDIAARGIDIPAVSHVINFDTPQHAEDYVHRIGRTGRASTEGVALTFTSRNELKYLKSIEDLIGGSIELADEKNAAAYAYPASQTPSAATSDSSPAAKVTVTPKKEEVAPEAIPADSPRQSARPKKVLSEKSPEVVLVAEAAPAKAPVSTRPARSKSRTSKTAQAAKTTQTSELAAAEPRVENARPEKEVASSSRRSTRRRAGKPGTETKSENKSEAKPTAGPKANAASPALEIAEAESKVPSRQAPMSSYDRRREQANQQRPQAVKPELPAQHEQALQSESSATAQEPELDGDNASETRSKRSGRSRSRRSRRHKSEQETQQGSEQNQEHSADSEISEDAHNQRPSGYRQGRAVRSAEAEVSEDAHDQRHSGRRPDRNPRSADAEVSEDSQNQRSSGRRPERNSRSAEAEVSESSHDQRHSGRRPERNSRSAEAEVSEDSHDQRHFGRRQGRNPRSAEAETSESSQPQRSLGRRPDRNPRSESGATEKRPEREARQGNQSHSQERRGEQTENRQRRDRDQEHPRQQTRPDYEEPIAEGNESGLPPERMQLPKKQRSSRRQAADAIQNQETYTSTFYRNESDVDYLESDERQPDYVDANVWSYPMKQPYHQTQQRGGGNRGGNSGGGGANRSGDGSDSGNRSGNGNRSQSSSSSGNRRPNANSSDGNRSRRRR